jgi:hypothetical protein
MSVTRVQLVGNVSTGASFVGVVTATSFIGNVTGNASYASVAGVATYASVAGVSTYASVAGAPGGGGGTAALPAIAFDGDPNTGIYSPGADQLAVATNGTGRLFINSTGLVGIGTSSVGARFHIEDTDSSSAYSTASILGTQTSVYKQIVHTNQSTGTNEAGIVLRAGTSSNIAEWGISALRTGATSGDLIFRSRTGASTSAEFMRLTSTGLGINTTSPSQRLNLNIGGDQTWLQIDKSRASDEAMLQLVHTATNRGSRIRYANADSSWTVGIDGSESFVFTSGEDSVGAGGTERCRLDSSGRLLVGTSSNSAINTATFQGNSSAATGGSIIQLRRGEANPGAYDLGTIQFADSAGSIAATIAGVGDAAWGASDYPGRIVLATTADGASSPTERMRIINTGYVGINATAPTYNEKLGVTRTDTTTNAIVFQAYNSAATSTTKAQNALVRLSSNASGADGHINITDNIAYNYNFGGNNGGAYVQASSNGVRLSNGGTSWASDSDERVKDIIEPIDDGLSKVSTLRAVIGKYKTDDEDRRRTFLIAQDVQAVLPEAVYEEQGTLMLAYTDIIPLLVAALKESKERIEQLEAKVAALESA